MYIFHVTYNFDFKILIPCLLNLYKRIIEDHFSCYTKADTRIVLLVRKIIETPFLLSNIL